MSVQVECLSNSSPNAWVMALCVFGLWSWCCAPLVLCVFGLCLFGSCVVGRCAMARWQRVTSVGFEATPFRNDGLSHRLRPLGQNVFLLDDAHPFKGLEIGGKFLKAE